MRKGQSQLLIGIIVLTLVGVSIGLVYYFSFKPKIEINQTTTTTTSKITTSSSSGISSTIMTTRVTISTTQPTTTTSITTSSSTTTSSTTTSTMSTTSTTTTTAIPSWVVTEKYEPVIAGVGDSNIYSPTILYDEGKYKMWFGGWYYGSQRINDRISYAESTDFIHWTVTPDVLSEPAVCAGQPYCGSNDPTVVRSGGTLIMYYTCVYPGSVPNTGINTVCVAYSTNGGTS